MSRRELSGTEEANSHMQVALQLIAASSCEHSTEGPGACWYSNRTPFAKFTAEKWCDGCVALYALAMAREATSSVWKT